MGRVRTVRGKVAETLPLTGRTVAGRLRTKGRPVFRAAFACCIQKRRSGDHGQ